MQIRELKVIYGAPTGVSHDNRERLTPGTAARVLAPLLDDPSEVFGALLLTTRHALLGWHVISRGGLRGAVVEPRDVMRAAILVNASGVILAHNHPSGEPEPSPDDVELTTRIAAAGVLMGVTVLDHVIIGNGTGRYYSFKEAGRI
jgi:DNA repair protein RadC